MKAALLIMAIVFIFTAASFILSISFTRRGMTVAMEHELRLALDIADSLVSTKIRLLKLNAANISVHLEQAEDAEQMERMMAVLLSDDTEFLSLTVLNQNGIYADYGLSVCTAAGYENSIYLRRALMGEVDISSSHFDDKHEYSVIHIFIPMNGDFVLSATLSSATFSDMVKEFRLWNTGEIFIVEDAETLADMEKPNYLFTSKQISSTNVGWHIGISAPLSESTLRSVQNGQLLASVMFLAAGAVIAVFVSGFAVKPFIKIQDQNDILAGLYEEISMQAELINDEHERARILLDATPLACRLWNRRYEIFECNDETVRLFEVKSKVEYKEKFFSLSPEYQPDGMLSTEKTREILDKVFIEGRYVYNWMHRLADGTPLPAEITLVRVSYGGEDVIAGYTRDLREHERMMSGIKYRDELLSVMNRTAAVLLQSDTDGFERDLMDCMEMVAETVKVDRVYIWKNYEADGALYCSQLYEWASGEAPPKSKADEQGLAYGEILVGWEETLSEGKCINTLIRDMPPITREHLSKQGILSILVVPVFLQDKFWGFVGFNYCRHETVFTENEESILRAGGMLIANALQRHKTQTNLEAALIQTEKANSAKSDFLAGMSHEMRTPLNAIVGLSELMLDDESVTDENVAENLEKIYNAGETLLSLVNDILDISKIEAGKIELVENDYDVPGLINDIVTNNILRIGEKPIQFTLNINENFPAQLYGDELRIKQVISNLLSNAFKYTKQGKVELGFGFERDDETVWVTAWVSDTGIGIKDDDIELLFTDYAQADMRSNRKIEGTGLGLPIAKKMTELMDGTITVESEYGKGSTFKLKIRQKHVNNNVIGADAASDLKNFRYTSRRRKRNAVLTRLKLPYAHVLVVDDNLTNLDVAKGLMKPYGMRIDTAASGRQALDAVRTGSKKYNAIFMDHMMPEMDGIETLERIRALGTDYAVKVPIIALTANAITGNDKMFINKGFQDFLTKPIGLARLDAVIKSWVRNKACEADGIDMAAATERFGDFDVYLNVLRSFNADMRGHIGPLSGFDGSNLHGYEVMVHGIKGSARSICAEQTAEIAEGLEFAAKKGDLAYIDENNGKLVSELTALIDNLDRIFAELAAWSNKPSKPEPDREILAAILGACKVYDMDTVDASIKELEKYEYETNGEIVGWLWEKVQEFSIEEIINRLASG